MQQTKKHPLSGFTLVEIMIAIVIIVLLSQMGNLSSIFETKERSQVEEISVNVINVIDEVKTNALLGKTEESKIIRKRRISITLENPVDTIAYQSSYNLAENDEITYANLTSKDWFLQELDADFYECPGDTATPNVWKIITWLPGNKIINIIFENEKIYFENEAGAAIPALHMVILLEKRTGTREIHIDRRTGLTYERGGSPGIALCN